jgi:hypothetical protein
MAEAARQLHLGSGILVSALAVLDRYRDLSQQLVCRSLVSSWNVFDRLAPDGAWPEGPSYWSLAMRYAGLMVAALESTLGDSFGLAERPGFAQTGDFALHAVGPFGAAFNFGDSEPCFDMAPLAWFAHRFRRPIDARLIDQYDGWYLPFTVIWPKRPRAKPTGVKVPTGKVFHSNNLACFRNTWSSDPAAHPVYLAIKGGNMSGPGARSPPLPEDVFLHSQADAGSFVLDGARQRWIIDLGADDYDLPGYFDHGADNRSGARWRYYRTHTPPAIIHWSSTGEIRYPMRAPRSSAVASTATANGRFSIYRPPTAGRLAPFGAERR